MFNFLKNGDENRFSWDLIKNVEEGRENLGLLMPVLVYRLFHYTIKEEITKTYGKEASIDIFRNSGKLAGEEFAKNMLDLNLSFSKFMAHLQSVLAENKIGILRVEKLDLETGELILTVGEDLECSGLPVMGEEICNYDEGFLAGILKEYTKKDYTVVETDCWATGSRVCRFVATIK